MPILRIRMLPLFLVALTLMVGSVITGCSGAKETGQADNVAMAPLEGMPDEVRSAPAAVREAYQFAVANPEALEQIPCYCGCGAVGHDSNYACYVSDVAEDGSVRYDTHALGCSICVDIALDTKRMLGQGKSIDEIRAAIDQTYAQYGPSNIP